MKTAQHLWGIPGYVPFTAYYGEPSRVFYVFYVARFQLMKVDPEQIVQEATFCVAECDADGTDFVDMSPDDSAVARAAVKQ